MPRFSKDDVLDYMVVEALIAKGGQQEKEQQEQQKRDEWKQDFSKLREAGA